MQNEFHWHYCRVKIEKLYDAAAWNADPDRDPTLERYFTGWRVTPGEEIHIED